MTPEFKLVFLVLLLLLKCLESVFSGLLEKSRETTKPTVGRQFCVLTKITEDATEDYKL
jgi:hypothetical protein